MIKLRNIIMIFVLMIITSCSPIYQTIDEFEAPTSEQGKICANNCADKLTSCLNVCRHDQDQCMNIQSLKAENDYLRYVTWCQSLKKEMKKNIYDFQDYSKCYNGCNERCHSAHRLCHINCGGRVKQTQQCIAFCK